MTQNELIAYSLAIAAVACVAAWRGRYAARAVLAAALGIAILHGYEYYGHVTDDAYISFRYSHNLAHGHGLVWNPGERVEGYSNFLWVLLLAATEAVGLGIVEPARWLGLAATAGTLAVVYAFALELSRDERDATWTFAGTALPLVAAAPIAYWTFAGLEEPLFAFLALLALWLHVREQRVVGARPWSAGAVALAMLTRPEGALVGVVIFVAKAWRLAASRLGRERVRWLVAWLAIVAVPAGAFLAFRIAYYGEWLPNTYYQKVAGEGVLNRWRFDGGWTYVVHFWREYGGPLIFPLPLLALLVPRLRSIALPLLAFAALWVAYVVYVGGDFLEFYRFLAIVLPIAYLLCAALALEGVRSIERGSGRVFAELALPALLLASMAWLMHVPQRGDNNVKVRVGEIVSQQRAEIAAWVRAQDPGVVVAGSAAGEIPYWSRARSIDTLGLTDKHIARQRPYTRRLQFPGHTKGDARYVIERRPDIVIVYAGLAPAAMTAEEWRTRLPPLLADIDLLRQPDVWDVYEPATVRLAGGYFNYLRLKGTTKVEGG